MLIFLKFFALIGLLAAAVFYLIIRLARSKKSQKSALKDAAGIGTIVFIAVAVICVTAFALMVASYVLPAL